MKVFEMALIHDLAEVSVGDITPADGVPEDVKVRREMDALSELTMELPNQERCLELLQEYQAQETEESKWVKGMDKLDMTLQSWNYEASNPNLNLTEFRQSASPILRGLGLEAASREKIDPS